MTLKLYHGNKDMKSLESIVNNGFDMSKIGSGWGTTYGDGIYFTDNLQVAHRVYSENNGFVVEVEVDVKSYQLIKDYSVNNKKEIKKIINDNIKTKKYNMLISASIEPEYVLFDVDCIVSIKLLKIDN
jgi:hypothetical protein